jgi:hypothetical protein
LYASTQSASPFFNQNYANQKKLSKNTLFFTGPLDSFSATRYSLSRIMNMQGLLSFFTSLLRGVRLFKTITPPPLNTPDTLLLSGLFLFCLSSFLLFRSLAAAAFLSGSSASRRAVPGGAFPSGGLIYFLADTGYRKEEAAGGALSAFRKQRS